MPETSAMSLRAKIHDVIEDGHDFATAHKWVNLVLYSLIVLSVLILVLGSVEELERTWHREFRLAEIVFGLVFSIEYLIRLWICVEDRAGLYSHPFLGRVRYALTPLSIIDLLAILPLYLVYFLAQEFMFLRMFRLLRILKMSRYWPALALFGVVIQHQGRALLTAVSVVVVLLMVSSGFMYAAERQAQPEDFGSIPAAMWWAVITLSTVGYGDVTPITPFGKLIAAIVAILGIGMFALPTAILGTSYLQELQRSTFPKTAETVANTPVFQDLGPEKRAEIAARLVLRRLPAGYKVINTGDQPDALYYIVDGQIATYSGSHRKLLEPGQFFGGRGVAPRRAKCR